MAKLLKLSYSLLIVIFVINITACKPKNTDGSNHIFRYDLPANPHTLDPQTAVDDSAALVIANLFEGLLRMDSAGNVTAGIAMEYEVSKDLLTYTFYLRDDVFWTDKNGFNAQCTANDFVFALRRLFNPEVKSRNASEYLCILNSRAINEGELPPKSLGVYADGDFKLVIELDYPDPNLPVLLTAPPSFPCNEEFYIQSAGRYGLLSVNGDFYVPSNSGFYLHTWFYDPHWTDENRIILRRRASAGKPVSPEGNTSSINNTIPSGINFYMDREGTPPSNFTSGKSDCIIISGEGADNLIKRDYPHTIAETSVWGIRFNKDSVFKSKKLRQSLAYATDRETIEALQELTGYRKTQSITPDSIKVGDNFYRDLLETDTTVSFKQGNSSNLITAPPVLIVPVNSENDVIINIIKSVTQQWQEKLSIFPKIELLSPYEYNLRLADGDYDMAAVRLTANYNSPSAILGQLTKLTPADGNTPEEIAEHFRLIEVQVLQSADFIPICFMTEYFFRHKKSEDLLYNPFTGAVNFSNAKMY